MNFNIDVDDYAEQGQNISKLIPKHIKRYEEILSTDFHFSPVAFEANQLKILWNIYTKIHPLIWFHA